MLHFHGLCLTVTTRLDFASTRVRTRFWTFRSTLFLAPIRRRASRNSSLSKPRPLHCNSPSTRSFRRPDRQASTTCRFAVARRRLPVTAASAPPTHPPLPSSRAENLPPSKSTSPSRLLAPTRSGRATTRLILHIWTYDIYPHAYDLYDTTVTPYMRSPGSRCLRFFTHFLLLNRSIGLEHAADIHDSIPTTTVPHTLRGFGCVYICIVPPFPVRSPPSLAYLIAVA